MKDTDYAYCVARIRANESKLLTADFINKLIEAVSYDDAVRLLVGADWISSGDENKNFIKIQSNSLWQLLNESIPDRVVLEGLCILNDYFNIKTAVKCIISGENADEYYAEPSTLELEKLCGSIDGRLYDAFKNERMKDTAKKAFETACITNNGQITETVVDTASLEALYEMSLKSKYKTFSEICRFIVDASNIRTAIRCSVIGRNADYISSAISSCCKINRDKLISEASSGFESLRTFLLSDEYAEGVALYYENAALYDKWFDAKVLEISRKSGFTAFGFDPVCAYFYRKNNEIKTVKLILSAKKSGAPIEIIRERVGAYA